MTKPVTPYELFDIYDKTRFNAQINAINTELLQNFMNAKIRHGDTLTVHLPGAELSQREHWLICREFESCGWMTVKPEVDESNPDMIYYIFQR